LKKKKKRKREELKQKVDDENKKQEELKKKTEQEEKQRNLKVEEEAKKMREESRKRAEQEVDEREKEAKRIALEKELLKQKQKEQEQHKADVERRKEKEESRKRDEDLKNIELNRNKSEEEYKHKDEKLHKENNILTVENKQEKLSDDIQIKKNEKNSSDESHSFHHDYKRRKEEREKVEDACIESRLSKSREQKEIADKKTQEAKRRLKEEQKKREAEIQQIQDEKDEAARKVRIQKREQAFEELQNIRAGNNSRRISFYGSSLFNENEKENLDKCLDSENRRKTIALDYSNSMSQAGFETADEEMRRKASEEQKRKTSYSFIKNQDDINSAHVKEAESGVAASHKAREEASAMAARVTSPVYYNNHSAIRRLSADNNNKTVHINDDLADEVEAIRLAADFSSRKLMMDMEGSNSLPRGSTASSSRQKIRALLDKQKVQREEASSSSKDADYSMGRMLWVYR